MVGYILSQDTEYALRILLYLLPYGTVASMAEAAGYMQVSREKIRVIGSKLKLADILRPVTGSYGGYTLSKNPRDISLYDVVACMERSKKVEQGDCEIIETLFAEAQRDYIEFLKETTLDDLYARTCGEKKSENAAAPGLQPTM